MLQDYSPQVLKYVKPDVLEKIKLRQFTVPQAVSVTKNLVDERDGDVEKRQEKFLTLPENIKDKLVSQETSNKIQEIGKTYNLQLLQLADISRAIRSYYFGEIHLEDFPSILYKEMGVDLNTAKEISQIVIQKIINDDSLEKAYQAQLTKISLPDALAKYPTVADQFVTSESIKIRGGQEPVRPTIKNWVSDYTYSVGYESHDTITRGNYMFQNENAKRLSAEDRNKLSYILKSYDEKTPVTIDTTKKQIVFPAMAKQESMKQEAMPAGRQVSRPVYNFDNIQSAGAPIRPQFSPEKQAPQNNLEKNYEHYHIPQKPEESDIEHRQDASQNIREVRFGSPEFKPVEQSKTSQLVFSSPQKLPFEKEKEQKFSPPAPVTPPAPVRPQMQPAPPKPFVPERPQAPIEPQPLHIAPATPYDDGKEELPRNVVNLKDV
ncbi:MAG: hypothetical protein WCV59_01755 [Parcubacteria group bacterium]|jgi:hypothetical protein